MSTRQKIIELLEQNLTATQIAKQLGVNRSYVYSVKSTLKKPTKVDREEVSTCNDRDTITLRCKYCKMKLKVRVNDREAYTKEVRRNWTCGLCPKSRNK